MRDGGYQDVLAQFYLRKGHAAKSGIRIYMEFECLGLPSDNIVKCLNRALAGVFHSTNIADDACAGQLHGVYEGINSKMMEGVDVFGSVYLGNDLGHASLHSGKRNNKVFFVDIGERNERIGGGDALLVEHILLASVSLDYVCFGKHIGKLPTALRVLLDNSHTHVACDELSCKIIRCLAASDYHDLLDPVAHKSEIFN